MPKKDRSSVILLGHEASQIAFALSSCVYSEIIVNKEQYRLASIFICRIYQLQNVILLMTLSKSLLISFDYRYVRHFKLNTFIFALSFSSYSCLQFINYVLTIKYLPIKNLNITGKYQNITGTHLDITGKYHNIMKKISM